MSAPLILTTTHRALAGSGDGLHRAAADYAAFVERSEPGLVALAVGGDEDTVTLRHVFADAAAADEHLDLAAGPIADSFQVSGTAGISVVGEPGPALTGLLTANREAGVPVETRPVSTGFVRR